MINVIFENLPEEFTDIYPTMDSLRKALTFLSGHVVRYYLPDGSERVEADSISFDKIGQAEFEDIYNRCVDSALKYFGLPFEIKKELALNF